MVDEQYEPILKYAITTYELDEEQGTWVKTLTHIIYGDTMEEVQGIIAAHRKADAFFNGSFLGNYADIKLKNEVIGLI